MPAEANRPAGIFVTGTDTGVGKTLVASALARLLARAGFPIGVIKPVETGVDDPSGVGSDAALLAWASNTPVDAPDLAPLRYPLPLAPSQAAEQAGERILPDTLIQAVRRQQQRNRYLVIEGAGGLMVPLSGGYLIADLARDLGFPLLVVCRPDLGTINHTLLTLTAARHLEIPIAGFVINGLPEEPDLAQSLAPHALASLAPADLLGVLPRTAGTDRDKILALADAWERSPLFPLLLQKLRLPAASA